MGDGRARAAVPATSAEGLARREEVRRARLAYRFDHRSFAPLALQHVPLSRTWSDAKQWASYFGLVPGPERAELGYVLGRHWNHRPLWANALRRRLLPDRFADPSDHARVFGALPVPAHAAHGDDPAFLGFAHVAGPSPEVVERPRALSRPRLAGLARLPWASAWRGAGLGDPPGDDAATLAAALGAGRVVVADYGLLRGLPLGADGGRPLHLGAPVAVFLADREGALAPVAVAPGGEGDPGLAHVVLPSAPRAFRVAMAVVGCALVNHHEMVAHLLHTHFALEAVVVSVGRTLSRRHPLGALLRAHLRHVLLNNFLGRIFLVSETGYASRVMSLGREGAVALLAKAARGDETVPPLGFATWDLPGRLRARGFAAEPGGDGIRYPYRDDALDHWAALRDALGAFVALYYPDDGAVAGDDALQAFLGELGAPDGGRLSGLPAGDTRADVVEVLLRVIFASSVQHAAVNYPQYAFAGSAAVMPGSLRAFPAPAGLVADDADAADGPDLLARMLPPPERSTLQAEVLTLLTCWRPDRLGHYRPDDLPDADAHAVMADYRRALDALGDRLRARDAGRPAFGGYPWLFPENVPQSTSL